ncbi:MAG: hypothetical protein N3G19_00185 [Candidatus Pacearchaeota archaeon]|nr:hypothetical protein [Candidatus Pacearchaeota archaeon]
MNLDYNYAYLILEEVPHDTTNRIHKKHLEVLTEIYFKEKEKGNYIAIFTEYLSKEDLDKLNKLKKSEYSGLLEKFIPLVNSCNEQNNFIFPLEEDGWYTNNSLRSKRLFGSFIKNYNELEKISEQTKTTIIPILLLGMPHKDIKNFLFQRGIDSYCIDIFKKDL